MLPLISWWRPPSTSLDISCFPHILEKILDCADLHTLLALRQTCRGMQKLVDARFAHVLAGPDGSLRAVATAPAPPSAPSPGSPPTNPIDQYAGVDVTRIVEAWCHSAASGPQRSLLSLWPFSRTTVKVKPFIFATARQVDRYHCPGRQAVNPTPCTGPGEDGCSCPCAPVHGLVHFDRLEEVREWRCPVAAVQVDEEGSCTQKARAWTVKKRLWSLAARPVVPAL